MQVGGARSGCLRGLESRLAAAAGEVIVEAENHWIRPEWLSDLWHNRGVENREGGHFGAQALTLEP